jgi:hypothetical protein
MMRLIKQLWMACIVLVLAGCISAESPPLVLNDALPPTPTRGEPPMPTATAAPVTLPVLGDAPPIENDVWLNADAPLTLADLRGKVVLVEFWTFG